MTSPIISAANVNSPPPRGLDPPGATAAAKPAVNDFSSILYPGDTAPALPDEVDAPASFPDLNLDQIMAAITAGHEEYHLLPFLRSAAPDIATVLYRHAIMRDLDHNGLLSAVKAFAVKMRSMREQITTLNKLSYPLQKQAVFLDAIAFYCKAIMDLGADLGATRLESPGLNAFQRYVERYVRSPGFLALRKGMEDVRQALAGIEYTLLMPYTSVTVRKLGSEPDYGEIIETIFARFKQGAVREYDFKSNDFFEMNHIENGILEFVARIYSEKFSLLENYFLYYQDYIDPVIKRWDREIEFYIAYLDYIAPMKGAGLPFCYPTLCETSKAVQGECTFDIALANKLIRSGAPIVTNDFELAGEERIFVVSGPNQGGKTTFARTFGQLHWLGRLGLPVPGARVTLFFFDMLLTHFEKQEDIHNHRGKLEDDLVRVHAILEAATPRSIVILNEIFTSTTLHDALFLAHRVIDHLIRLDLLCVCVTFMDELSTIGPQTVSLVSTVVPDNPAERTYRVVRHPADGRSYALSIAEKYQLTYDQLRKRIAS